MLDQAVRGEYFGIAQSLANVLLWGFWTLSSICWRFPVVGWCSIGTFTYIYYPLLLHWNTNDVTLRVTARAPLFAHVHLATPRGVPHPTRLGPWLPMIQTSPEWPARPPLLHWCGRPPAEPKEPALNGEFTPVSPVWGWKEEKNTLLPIGPHLAGGEQHQILDLYFLRRAA